MRIAVIAPSVFAINSKMDYGGSEVVIWNLINELGKMDDVEYTLFAPKGSEAPGGELVETITPPKEFGDEELRAIGKYAHHLEKFDIINDHTHQALILQWPRGAQKAWGIVDIPIVKVFHGLQTWPNLPTRLNTTYIVLSQYHYQDCCSKYPDFPFPDPIHEVYHAEVISTNPQRYGFKIIPHGIDLEKYAFEPDKDDYYFHPGLIAPHKGHRVTLDLAEKMPAVRFKIGGEDQFIPDRRYRDWVIQNCENIDNVEYLGTLKDAEKVKLLQRAKAVLLPFEIGEAFSLLATEGLGVGGPVITSNLGSMPEIINDGSTGYLRHGGMGMQNDFVDAVQRVETGGIDPEACRKDAEERFGSKLMAERYVGVFREVVTNGKQEEGNDIGSGN